MEKCRFQDKCIFTVAQIHLFESLEWSTLIIFKQIRDRLAYRYPWTIRISKLINLNYIYYNYQILYIATKFLNNWWTDTSLRYRHWRMRFERLLQAFARWQPGNLFDIAAQPILEYRELIVIHNCPCEHSSKLQLSIRFTPSRCLDVREDWYPMYYPEGIKARVSPVQSIEPHRILAPTRDLNWEPLGLQSRVVTTILPLHTSHFSKHNMTKFLRISV